MKIVNITDQYVSLQDTISLVQ